MELDDKAKIAVRDLSEAINSAIGSSRGVSDAIEYLRDIGYEPHLTLKLEIALAKSDGEYSADEFEMSLTQEDLRTLERMKIKFE